ncbi:hypothetical protein GOP47_0001923 [Adiantum capillus-veneris]|uniref:N-acetyltransferase domain-containing protein n=1 Tax=Adiantum capillus-veneris TaxID=13818 RepID=A0A9D4ZR54_ADICA|nr:hypothetical protein GOP47_0001923 [Adiantum capillus-veneris]
MQEVVAGGHLQNLGCLDHLPLGSPSARFYSRFSRSHGGFTTTSNLVEVISHGPPAAVISNTVPYDTERPLQIAVREATIVDFWEVADTHCGAFLPELVFPMDALMRLDRVVAMVGGLTVPLGCRRNCLVAVSDCWHSDLGHREQPLENEPLAGLKLSSVLGVLTVDTLADFLPRRKSTGSRRTGIAYISNVAVRQTARRKGIARRLVQEAELAFLSVILVHMKATGA